MAMEHVVRLTKKDLMAAEPILDTVLDNTVDAAALINRDRKVIYISPGFAELTGQSLADYHDHPMRELKFSGQDHVDEVLRSGIRQMAVPMQVGAQKLLVNLVPIVSQEDPSREDVIGVMVLITFRSMAVLKRAIQTLERSVAPNMPESSASAFQDSRRYTFSDYIGEADNIVLILEQCQRISYADHPILLVGETGVGKEIIADAIYSERYGKQNLPFVKINCSAIPKDLLESELFGHEKGAFTGATNLKKGKFELAAGGVLLLDEIGEMSYELQSKLLRVLENREFERIGGSKVIPMRARIIASTNQDLKQLVADGKFRLDLYYRLNTFEITIPPLRAHKEDIPLLVNHFRQLDHLDLVFSEDAKSMLMNYDWPGNVRELRNVLNRMSFLYPNTVIDTQQVYNATGEMFHLVELPKFRNQTDPLPQPTKARSDWTGPSDAPASDQSESRAVTEQSASDAGFLSGHTKTMQDYEKLIIRKAVEETGGNLTEAALLLGISRASIYNKVKKYGI